MVSEDQKPEIFIRSTVIDASALTIKGCHRIHSGYSVANYRRERARDRERDWRQSTLAFIDANNDNLTNSVGA